MAVRIPIITVFDSKGLRQAQYQLGKVRGNFQALGRNAAIAGAAIGAFGAAIATSARSLARIEKINAQTVAVLKSMGQTANGTAKDIENLAGRLEALTATEAETIQEGANLLLTFKNVQNQVGENNDIFDQTVGLMVDVARAMGTTASGEAIRLGKALNDPIKGISALTRVGIQFTNDQKAQIKALADSGDLMGAQKIILAELQAQFGGSGAAFAKTFTGQLELLQHELGTVGEEATMAVMPALREMIAGFREIIPIIGPQLKAAIESVDWKAFSKSIVDLTTFLIQNAGTIMRVVGTLFILNTAFNLLRVTQGLYNAAAVITNVLLAKTGTVATTTTAAVGLLRTALFLGGVTLAVGGVINEYRRLKEVIETSRTPVSQFNKEVIAITGAAAKIDPVIGLWNKITYAILGAVTAQRRFNNTPVGPDFSGYQDAAERRRNLDQSFAQSGMGNFTASLQGGTSAGAGGASATARTVGSALAPANKALNLGVAQAKQAGRLQAAGFSQAYIDNLFSAGGKTVAAAKAAVKKASTSTKFVTNQNKKAASTLQAITAANEAAAQANAAAEAAAQQAIEEAARREAEALAERQRVLSSFANSVISTFAAIREGILNSFSLPELGGSTDSIIRNMDKLIAKTKAFSQNITKLSSMGLNPELLQQVIQAGPVGGARLAASLVAGGADALGRINAGFGEIGALSSEIAMTGTQSRFDTPTQQNVYNINVEGGVGSGATIGKAIVDAIKAYERTSGAVWQGA
jgi:hypothetical protein